MLRRFTNLRKPLATFDSTVYSKDHPDTLYLLRSVRILYQGLSYIYPLVYVGPQFLFVYLEGLRAACMDYYSPRKWFRLLDILSFSLKATNNTQHMRTRTINLQVSDPVYKIDQPKVFNAKFYSFILSIDRRMSKW